MKKLLDCVNIYEAMPEGWSFVEGATTAPKGYRWIHNNKSRFSGERKTGFLKTK